MAQSTSIGFLELDKLPVPPRYHAFLLDGYGRVVRVEKLLADHDGDASHQARMLVDGHAVDLWDGVRFIQHFEHPAP